jgi:hypothetical protein
MKKLLAFLVNPFVLPLIPAVIIILFLPFNYDRYLLEVVETKKLAQGVYEWYDDLTLDGNSERIFMRDNGSYTWVAIYDHNDNLFNQWNLLGNLDFAGLIAIGITGDYDHCGQKEIFFFTLKNDSIFLHAIQDLENPSLAIHNRFISKTGPGKGKPDPRFLPAEMDDLNGDGKKELIFGLSGGFSLYPRNVFAYYIDRDSLVRSPESFYHITWMTQSDFTRDGKKEIFLTGMASSNVAPSEVKFHDHSNWVMVLDHNLEFLFEPIEIKGRANSFAPLLFNQDEKSDFNGILTRAHNNENATLYSFDPKGEVSETRDLGIRVNSSFVIHNKKGKSQLVLSSPVSGTHIYDLNSKTLKSLSNSFIGLLQHFDFDGDDSQEVITFSYNQSEISVFREGMRHGAKANIHWTQSTPRLFSIKESTTAPPQISLQLGQDHYLLSYGPNPAYYLNFLYYLLIYAGMLGFAFTTRNIQKRQIQRKLDTEKKITELQLSMVKNQLDPHFTMNAINSIIHSVNQNHKEKANENLHRFSRLYRSMLLSADSTRRSLEDELNFCRDYLELEKARFDNAFEFEINMAENLDLKQLVPKMIIQTHAENAVKHGLSAVPQGGKLRIDITFDGQQLEIEISDNGIGRQQAAKKAGTSTGKGLALMKEFYQLYKKYYKQDISADIQDVFDEEGKTSGTKVIIKISRHDESN